MTPSLQTTPTVVVPFSMLVSFDIEILLNK
jgi:hypothetical protein